MSKSPFVPTITIIDDPHPNRGYSLVDREFMLKYPEPVETEAKWLDGTIFKEKYYVVDLREYMRVVPEAANDNCDWTKDILIPIYLCHRSFKPSYIR